MIHTLQPCKKLSILRRIKNVQSASTSVLQRWINQHVLEEV